MAAYTYAPAPVLVESTGEFAIGATGVLRPTTGSDPVPVYDLNGSPLASVLVGPKGAHQAFTADIPDGVLDFGSVLLPTSSLEQQRAGLEAVGIAQAALDAASAAQQSAAAAAADVAAAVASAAGATIVVHGDDPNVPRPGTSRPVVWLGTVDPVNSDDARDVTIYAAVEGERPAPGFVVGDGIDRVVTMTLADYNALTSRPTTTMYVLPGAGVRLGSVDIATGTTTPEAPAPSPSPTLPVPQDLTAAVVGTRQVQLTWTAVTGASSYAVYEERSGWTTPVAVVTEPTRTSGTLGVSNPVYTYRVKARFPDGGESDFSQSVTVSVTEGSAGDTTVPSTPTGLTAVASGTSTATVSWSAATDNVAVTGYQVRRGLVTVASAVTGLSYADSGLNPATTYEYAVRAYDAAGNFSDWSAPVSTTTDAAPTTPPPAAGGSELTLFTDAQIASLSTTSAAALRAKGIADQVRAGSAANDLMDVNNRVGPTALCAVLWWARTADASYLAPAKSYILAAPKAPSGTQALNPWRGFGGLFAAVQILKRLGQWDDQAAITGSYGGTWANFVSGLETRSDWTGNGRWNRLGTTADDSFNNWGAVANFARLALAAARGDTALATAAANRHAKYLGEQITGVADANSSNDYRSSWDNWMPGNSNGSGQKLRSGVGQRDASRPGLDGVIIDDINRGGTDYSSSAAYWGATGSGLTYPLEAADYLWATSAMLLNAGYPVRTWGDAGLVRMNDRLARKRTSGEQSQLEYGENAFAVYKGGRWVAARLAQADYGTPPATASGVGGLPRSIPYGDWIAGPGSTWGQ